MKRRTGTALRKKGLPSASLVNASSILSFATPCPDGVVQLDRSSSRHRPLTKEKKGLHQ
jgi:hypothetical protein